MLRSLFAGISGLRVNQTMLDVTGNNIANANTTGFKASTTVFQDTLSQMLTGASGANADRGGTNPIQVGLGVQVAAHQHQLQPGLGADHRPRHRPDDPGRRHVRGPATATSSSTPAPARSPSTRPAPWSRPTGNRVQGYALDAAGDPTGGLVDVTLDTAALGAARRASS